MRRRWLRRRRRRRRGQSKLSRWRRRGVGRRNRPWPRRARRVERAPGGNADAALTTPGLGLTADGLPTADAAEGHAPVEGVGTEAVVTEPPAEIPAAAEQQPRRERPPKQKAGRPSGGSTKKDSRRRSGREEVQGVQRLLRLSARRSRRFRRTACWRSIAASGRRCCA